VDNQLRYGNITAKILRLLWETRRDLDEDLSYNPITANVQKNDLQMGIKNSLAFTPG